MDGKAEQLLGEAVRATYLRWTALNLAVAYQFGDGSESLKREELIQQTLCGFIGKKRYVLSLCM
jgi:hypothetical protein